MTFTKHDLVRHLMEIARFIDDQDKGAKALNTLIEGNCVFTLGSAFIDSYIRLLSQIADDTDEWIAWYIWENDFGKHHLKAMVSRNEGVTFDGEVGGVDELWALLEASKDAHK